MPGFIVRALLPAAFVLGCAEPAVLRAPPGGPSMPEPVLGASLPLPALAEPTGGPLIALPPNRGDGPTALSPSTLSAVPITQTAVPRSGRAATP
ncbi:hypothetical protein ACE7GA_24645 [Roseomonas sp. CCTCC AB2023176]|uniref:hypothetical protein n=1 Tax=Roseomonas sp. CCTCC AB2023176 TaxID=3342640 RepID=UPI0035DA2391